MTTKEFKPDFYKPCPFCGGECTHYSDDIVKEELTCMECHACFYWTGVRDSEEEIKLFNERHPDKSLDQLAEQIRRI